MFNIITFYLFLGCVDIMTQPAITDSEIAQVIYQCAATTGYTGPIEGYLP